MKIKIRGKNITLSESLKRYSEEKIKKLDKYFDGLIEADLELIAEKSKSIKESQRIEVTILASGRIIRGEESSENMYASIDKVVEKLERQIKRHKARLRRSGKLSRRSKAQDKGEQIAVEEKPNVVRTKRFAVKPMDSEEAAWQMELLGHSFFVFLNTQTREVNVVYKRKDGNYGLIEPEF